jgi:aminoglycoside 6'-N-acetyltransferase
LSLVPFAPPNLVLLEAWLKRPHVARWYPHPDENLGWAATPPPGGSHVLIAVRNVPVGYIRWQVVDRETLDSVGLNEVPANAVDIDLLLGEQDYVGRGIGPAALELLVKQLSSNRELPVAGLTSSVENTYAHAAFRKAGFLVARQYSPPGFGLCHLFLRSLKP